MRCLACEKGMLRHRVSAVEGEYRGKKLKVETSAEACSKCGYALVEARDMQEFMRRLSDAYRSSCDLLTSQQIRAARESLGMSQKRFAAYLRVSPASIKRWELGAVQDAANDEYIRVKTDPETASQNAANVVHLRKQADEMRVFMSHLKLKSRTVNVANESGSSTGISVGVLTPVEDSEWQAIDRESFVHSA